MDAAAKAIIAKINKKHGAGTIVLGSDIQNPFLDRIPSGSLSLDVALGGGIANNHWLEIVGMESSGKTMLTLQIIATNQKRDPNWTVVWFAAEDFVDSYAQMWGCDLDRIIVVQENIMETVYETAIEFIESRSVDCVVVDSLPALVPGGESKKSMEDDLQPGLGARLTGQFFRKVGAGMGRAVTRDERPVVGLLLNQWRSKIGSYGDPRTTPGGVAKNYFCFQRIEVRRDEWIKNTKDQNIGQVLKVVNIKNKQAPPGRVALIDAYFDRGNGFEAGEFDVVKDVIAAGIAYGIIERAGAYFSFNDERWQGRNGLAKAIRQDPDLQEKIYSAVLSATALKPKSALPPRRRKRRVAPAPEKKVRSRPRG